MLDAQILVDPLLKVAVAMHLVRHGNFLSEGSSQIALTRPVRSEFLQMHICRSENSSFSWLKISFAVTLPLLRMRRIFQYCLRGDSYSLVRDRVSKLADHAGMRGPEVTRQLGQAESFDSVAQGLISI
jgi:hypothetical protein